MSEGHLVQRLERLAEKYRVLAGLKRSREAAEAAGEIGFSVGESAERTQVFRRVAAEFPGALRELEHSPSSALEARRAAVLEEIEALRRGGPREAPAREWVAAVLEYHDTLREALAVKMWIASNVESSERLTERHVEAFRTWHGGHPARHTPTERFDQERIERYRRPPDGRLHSIVWELLGTRFGRGRRSLEKLVFSPPA